MINSVSPRPTSSGVRVIVAGARVGSGVGVRLGVGVAVEVGSAVAVGKGVADPSRPPVVALPSTSGVGEAGVTIRPAPLSSRSAAPIAAAPTTSSTASATTSSRTRSEA